MEDVIDFIVAVADVVSATKFEWQKDTFGLWETVTPTGFTVGVNLQYDSRGNGYFAMYQHSDDGSVAWDLRPIPTLELAKEACERYWRGDL